MLMERLRARNRAPSAVFVGVAECKGRKLTFRKVSKDLSGKCDATLGLPDRDVVHGVVFDVPESEMRQLDKAEGRGAGYERVFVPVTLGGESVEVLAYIAQPNRVDDGLRPYRWYLDLVMAGAEQHGLPDEYRRQIAATIATIDPEITRPERLEAEAALAAYKATRPEAG